MKNIIIWGAGRRTAVCLERKLFHGVNILAVVDSWPKEKTFAGYALAGPQEIENSVERMLGNLPYPEKAKICKGLFPASVTAEAEKEKFAFVSLDVDFEESTYEGLKFFYPRLSEGGCIFCP